MKELFFIKHWFELHVICSWKLLQVSAWAMLIRVVIQSVSLWQKHVLCQKNVQITIPLLPKIAPSV